MKKLFLSLALILFVGINAQTTDGEPAPIGSNDFMIDPIMLIAAPVANLSYERLLNKDSGIGINAIFGLGRDFTGFSQFSPYYRMYFGKKYAAGFFLDGFVPISTTTTKTYNNSNTPTTEKNTSFGIGLGFGGKWVAKKNIVFEASTGIARRLGDNTDSFESPLTGKLMLGIGYRF